MPLPLSDYASLIEPTRLAIILLMPLYPLSPWERVRVRGLVCLASQAQPNVYREISFSLPLIPDPSPPFLINGRREQGEITNIS